MEKETNNKILSIVIPIRITENNLMDRYLDRCLSKIANQECISEIKNKFEVVVSDDNSFNDSVFKLCNKYSDINIKYVKCNKSENIMSENAMRPGGARNEGLKNSSGNYIWYIDADDMIKEYALKDIIQYLENNDYEAVFVQFEIIKLIKENKFVSEINNMKLDDYSCAPVSPCCKIIRKDICVEFPEYVYMEDVLQSFMQLDQISDKSKVGYLTDKPYWIYDLRRPTNFTSTSIWLQMNNYTIKQLLLSDIMKANNLKWNAVGDVYHVVGDLWNYFPHIKHQNVKNAVATRLVNITNKIITNNYTH